MSSSALHGTTGRLLTVTGVTGIAYALSWIAGLSIPAPSPPLSASGAEITAALAGHGTAVAAQFTLTEGLPAAGLAVVSMALARAASRSGAAAAARAAFVAGLAAALVSLVQFLLGMALATASGPGTAHALYDAVNRLDGIKMFLLAIVAPGRGRLRRAAPVAALDRDRPSGRPGLLRRPLPAAVVRRRRAGLRVRTAAPAVHHRQRHRSGPSGSGSASSLRKGCRVPWN